MARGTHSSKGLEGWPSAVFAWQRMWMSAAEVIWWRSMQMALGTMTRTESTNMVMEKPVAFAKAAQEAAFAAATGKTPAQIARAGLKPVSRKAGSNASRLRRSALTGQGSRKR
jgi:hypothetical protein